jgi:hypothetical protein
MSAVGASSRPGSVVVSQSGLKPIEGMATYQNWRVGENGPERMVVRIGTQMVYGTPVLAEDKTIEQFGEESIKAEFGKNFV